MSAVPVRGGDLREVYSAGSVPAQAERCNALRRAFESRFGRPAQYIARAPGRVNLIGEHIDYCGYSVLPMAVEKDIIVAVATDAPASGTSAPQLHCANTSAKYAVRTFTHGAFTIEAGKHDWSSYFLAGYKKYFEETPEAQPKTLQLVFDGTVPPGSGLSSSSAMVCVSILATQHAVGGRHTLPELADIAIRGERYVGVQSGGMDQSISLMAEIGHAKLIDFHPLKLTSVNLPGNASFIIANSLVTSNKQETAPKHYNLRVTECRFAAKLLYRRLKAERQSGASVPDEPPNKKQRKEDAFINLKDVQEAFGLSFAEAIAAVERHLHKAPYDRRELAEALDTTVDALEKEFLSVVTVHGDAFRLHDRALHVFSEAKRVFDFKAVCDQHAAAAGAAGDTHAVLQALGKLMNESQTSCHELFDCSCPELEQLTKICRDNGAFGSRLTGAGWGGCTVSLIEAGKEEAFIAAVVKAYYRDGGHLKEGDGPVEDAIFATRPGSGGCVIPV